MAIVDCASCSLAGSAASSISTAQSKKPAPEPPPLSGEARAYASKLKLIEVEMKAHESYLKQSVVEITGNIQNIGDRVVKLVEINCVFYDAYGQVVLRERVPIVSPQDRRRVARADQALPPAVRQRARKLESGHAATGHGRHRIPVAPASTAFTRTRDRRSHTAAPEFQGAHARAETSA